MEGQEGGEEEPWCQRWCVHVSGMQMEQVDDGLHSIFPDSRRRNALGNRQICLEEIS